MSTSSYSDVINHNVTVGYGEAKLLQVPCIEKKIEMKHSTSHNREITIGKTKLYTTKVLKEKSALNLDMYQGQLQFPLC